MWAMMPAVTTVDYATFKSLLLVALMPPTPMVLLAAWGGWRLRRARRFGGWMLGLALAGLWMSTTEAAGELLSRAVGFPAPLNPERLPALRTRGDGAVLVLGGGVRYHLPEYDGGAPNRITAERLAYGVWLARRTGWPLGFTGGVGWTVGEQRLSEADVVSRVAAEDYRLPLRWAERRARDTRENASYTLPMLADDGVRQVLLVTHDAHMRRALRAFEADAARLGIQVLAAPVGLQDDGLGSFSDWCPSAEGYARVRYLVYEQLAWWAGH